VSDVELDADLPRQVGLPVRPPVVAALAGGALALAVVGLVLGGASAPVAIVVLGALAALVWLGLAWAGLIRVASPLGRRARGGLQIDQMDRLRRAELALAEAASSHDAARELADHAIALLGARSAVVLIEGIGDTVRVTAGEGTVYGDGSRMRLLDDAGVPCGSIAVSARADGRAYTDAQERMLDALAQRVSSTLHRLSLFAEVQAERRTIADVLESSSDGIFVVGQDLAVKSWNPAMAWITGTSQDDALAAPVGAVFRPVAEDGAPRHGSADPGRTGRPVTELVRIGSDEDPRWLRCSWSPLSEGGYVVVARDETERKNLQDDKDGWIAQVSHELRTPLTPIKGFLHTLQRRDAAFSAEDRQRIYEVMLREEQRLEDLVSSLLQSTTLDRKGPVSVPEVLDWHDLVDQQVDLYRRSDPTRTVELDVHGPIPPVVADPALAVGVLTNLISNGRKYAPEGTTLHVRLEVEGGHVVTVVGDEGPGVPANDRERIFDKFTRLGDHLTRAQQGVGLGLFIARRSVEHLGGTITCGDRPGGGAEFRFTLPVHNPETSPERALRAHRLRA
jgi:PAS domain S-box-containing protein